MAKHLFIADLHLSPERPEIIQLFIDFLNQQAAQAESLYILGDFVEYWLGDDDNAKGLDNVFNALKQLADKGLKIFIMHGNRDFLMSDAHARRYNCTLIHEPYIAIFDNQPVLLMHGDTLCTDDVSYQKFRSVLRSDAWKNDFLSKPLAERKKIAQGLREQSQAATRDKQAEIMDVNADAVKKAFIDNDIALIIHGHTHRPAVHELTVNNKPVKRIVLGDWFDQGSLLAFNNSTDFELISFSI